MNEKPSASRDTGYFDKLYETNPDPWNFATSEYERYKYDVTIESLTGRRFGSGFEVGCSIGVLTARLAAQCDRLLAVDLVPSALEEAARRCAGLGHVRFEQRRVPEEWPAETFDLIVLSEVLYFFTPADIAQIAMRAAAGLQGGGLVQLVNFTEKMNEPCGGQEAAELFIAAAAPSLSPIRQHRDQRFRVDVLQAS